LVSLSSYINPSAGFITALSGYTKDKLYGFNPHIIVTTSGHHILEKAITLYLNHFITQKKYTYDSWSIYRAFEKIFGNIFGTQIPTEGIIGEYQFIQEVTDYTSNRANDYCEYKGEIVMNNRQRNYDANTHTFIR